MKTTIQLFTLFFLISSLPAQTFTNYTTADGLLSNNVRCVAIDKNDHLWFGTQDGVSVFDQVSQWTSHTTTTDTGLVNNSILAIATMSNDDMWVGTDFGVSVYDGTSWKTYTEADGLADNRVTYIREDNDGDVWIGNSDGVTKFDGTTWTSWTMADGLPFGGVSCIAPHPNGDMYLGTKLGGVQIFDGTTFTEITENDGLLNDKVKSIAIDAQGNKWVATADGVSVFDDMNQLVKNHTRMYIMPPPDTLNPTEDIQINSKGQVWTGVFVDYLITVGGVGAYDGNSWIDYDVSDGVIGPVIRRLEIDSNDDVWVTTSTGVTEISNITLSIDQMTLENGFKVYPNPVSDRLHIERMEGKGLGADRLVVYNMLMQKMTAIVIQPRQSAVSLDFGDYAPGLYFVKINDYLTKVVVE
ncbi:T9SS type A sorting domain-containing protein [bacterium]|nr:T9SS type A sorting domain-containing protein [bacterium]